MFGRDGSGSGMGHNGQASGSWSETGGYQTTRAGFGYRPMSGAALLASLDDKVADADAKLRDFMAEIEGLDTDGSKEEEASSGLEKTSLPGFVSAGHVMPASQNSPAADGSTPLEEEETGDPLVEPTTPWQHLLDENTKHYYYWHMHTNEVTWTIPDDYTDFLLRHKAYREALAAGKKFMPRVTPKLVPDPKAEEVAPEIAEIGPQLPANLRKKFTEQAQSNTAEPNTEPTPEPTLEPTPELTPEAVDGTSNIDPQSSSTAATVEVPVTGDVTVKSADTLPAGLDTGAVAGVAASASHAHVAADVTADAGVTAAEESNAARSGTAVGVGLGLVGYESEDEDEPPDNTTSPEEKRGVIKSLVAYDDSYTAETDGHLTESYANATQSIVGPQLRDHNESAAAADPQLAEEYNSAYYQDTSLSFSGQNETEYQYHNKTELYGVYGDVPEEKPLIFTKPPPPPPPEEPKPEVDASWAGSSAGLSSTEISDIFSVITDKLHFLDVTTDNISQLQMVLIQLKTRLDDWQAGALKKEYLIEQIEETDRILEVCESESAPAGWKCNWSKKEKQYYYIHEITDEISWTYPDEDIQAVVNLAEQKKRKKSNNAQAGTLAQLSRTIDTRTVDESLKSLFAEKILQKFVKSTHTEPLDNELACVVNAENASTGEEETQSNTSHKSDELKTGYKDHNSRVDSPKIEEIIKPRKRAHSHDSTKEESGKTKYYREDKSQDKESSHKKSKKHKHKSKKSKHKKQKSSHKHKKAKREHSSESEDGVYKSSGEDSAKETSKQEANSGDYTPTAYSPEAGILELEPEHSNTGTPSRLPIAADSIEQVVTKEMDGTPESSTVKSDEVDGMDMSPIPSGVTTPVALSPPPAMDNKESSSVEAAVIVDKSEETTNGVQHMDSVDELFLAIEKETNLLKQSRLVSASTTVSQPLTSTIVTKPPPPPPPPEAPQPEETVPETTPKPEESLPMAAPKSYSTVAAPVLYTTQRGNNTLTAAPADLSSITSIDDNIDSSAQSSTNKNTVSTSNTSTKAPREKQKTKGKKSKSGTSKMPAALVQKWRKVQTEISKELVKETQLKQKILK